MSKGVWEGSGRVGLGVGGYMRVCACVCVRVCWQVYHVCESGTILLGPTGLEHNAAIKIGFRSDTGQG